MQTSLVEYLSSSDNNVHGAYMGPSWGRQDPGGPHVGPMNLAIKLYNDIDSNPVLIIYLIL